MHESQFVYELCNKLLIILIFSFICYHIAVRQPPIEGGGSHLRSSLFPLRRHGKERHREASAFYISPLPYPFKQAQRSTMSNLRHELSIGTTCIRGPGTKTLPTRANLITGLKGTQRIKRAGIAHLWVPMVVDLQDSSIH